MYKYNLYIKKIFYTLKKIFFEKKKIFFAFLAKNAHFWIRAVGQLFLVISGL